MHSNFLAFMALTGGDWVVYGLIACSILSLGVIIERFIVLRRELLALDHLRSAAMGPLTSGDWNALSKALDACPGSASRILRAGVAQARGGPAGVAECLAAATLDERRGIEHLLLALGTLGSNAPFVGLFGTVLGVIKAFHDLAQSAAGPEVVMQGLSEALIATAVGLFVAIPAVIGYNYLQKRAQDLMAGADAMGRLIVARSREAAGAGRR